MRLLAGIFLIAVLSRTVAAEDEEPEVRPVKPFGLAVYVTGHGGAIGGVSEGGVGPTVEVALGTGRTQYFLEGSVAWVALGAVDTLERGVMARGALGTRWIARSFSLDAAAIEMALEGVVGASKIWWDDGDELVRPELGLGVGLQLRKFFRPAASVRFTLRAFFAPADDEPMAVARCTRGCTAASPITDGGIMFSVGGGL